MESQPSASGSDASPADCRIGVTVTAGTNAATGAASKALAAPPPAHVPTAAAYISTGRPDLKTILTHAAAPYAPDGEAVEDDQAAAVGVFVAGPAPLVAAVADTCAAVNGVWAALFGGCCGGGVGGRAYLELHALTHEL